MHKIVCIANKAISRYIRFFNTFEIFMNSYLCFIHVFPDIISKHVITVDDDFVLNNLKFELNIYQEQELVAGILDTCSRQDIYVFILCYPINWNVFLANNYFEYVSAQYDEINKKVYLFRF